MSEKKLDAAHVASIHAVLSVLANARSVAHAMLVCEDVHVALQLGLGLGVSMADITGLVGELISESQPQDEAS